MMSEIRENEATIAGIEVKSLTNSNFEVRDIEKEFTEVVAQFSDMAYGVALRMLRNADDAEDAAQEAFISAYKAFPSFKGESKVSTWLYRIVVNTCLMKIRKEKSRSKYLSETAYDDAVVPDWDSDPVDAALNSELRSHLEGGLERLSPDLRVAVVLRDVQGLSTEEAAVSLNISVSSLKSRLHRARVLLRNHMADYLGKAPTGSEAAPAS